MLNDKTTEEVVRKHYRLLNKDETQIIKIKGDKTQIVGEDILRELLELQERNYLAQVSAYSVQNPIRQLLIELLVKCGVLEKETAGNRYFTDEVKEALYMLFSSINENTGYILVECSAPKTIPNCNGFDLAAGRLVSGTERFTDSRENFLSSSPTAAKTLHHQRHVILDYDWVEGKLKEPGVCPNYYYGFRTFSADKVVIQKINTRTNGVVGEPFELTSLWPERQLVVTVDTHNRLSSFAPVFLTRNRKNGLLGLTPDSKEYARFIEEGSEYFKEIAPKVWSELENRRAQEFAKNVDGFYVLLLWLEKHCS